MLDPSIWFVSLDVFFILATELLEWWISFYDVFLKTKAFIHWSVVYHFLLGFGVLFLYTCYNLSTFFLLLFIHIYSLWISKLLIWTYSAFCGRCCVHILTQTRWTIYALLMVAMPTFKNNKLIVDVVGFLLALKTKNMWRFAFEFVICKEILEIHNIFDNHKLFTNLKAFYSFIAIFHRGSQTVDNECFSQQITIFIELMGHHSHRYFSTSTDYCSLNNILKLMHERMVFSGFYLINFLDCIYFSDWFRSGSIHSRIVLPFKGG